MSFDKPTRNALERMVSAVRERLKTDITEQLQTDFRMQPDGTILPLTGLTEDQRARAEDLRELLDHFAESEPGADKNRRAVAYDRLVREIGFTVLNRLAALRLCEERGLVQECVRKGMTSDGFRLFDSLTGGAPGSRYATYRVFLENLFDELALDLGALFDRHSPLSHVFPSERALEDVLARLNDPTLAGIWREDETIGWIYQYYNDADERRKMRDESQAPRNSRELAVRNQFFTPRYVVEFLTDNTLGRIWYEMRQGNTRLLDDCRYLVRRKHPILLKQGEQAPTPYTPSDSLAHPDESGEMWIRPNPELSQLQDIWRYSLTVGGYDYARRHYGTECGDLANARREEYARTSKWEGTFEELRCCLFFEQHRYHHFGTDPEGEDLTAIFDLYKAICERWDWEVDIVPFREKKDPRRILMLDPAGGSGHFGLYCFDLFETIYTEAYDDPDLGPALKADYPNRDAFLRHVPVLILENNIHIIDIDPRACQIAALALWLRAQRSFQQKELKAAERPQIRKVNVVCAEPMPGERALLDEFTAELKPRVLADLVRIVFEKMKLAGEAGSLLKIEEELRDAIADAKNQWLKSDKAEQLLLSEEFAKPQKPEQLGLFDTSGVSDEQFWDQAEARVLDELRAYAGHATNGHATRRRLFIDDAKQGFALIDLCRKRYDVLLMNPPFGKTSKAAESYLRKTYPRNWKDLYAAFLERDAMVVSKTGYIGSITSSQFMHTKQLAGLREDIITKWSLGLFVHLGLGVLDGATVDVALSIISPSRPPASRWPTLYLDLTGIDGSGKDANLLGASQEMAEYSIKFVDDFSRIATLPLSFHSHILQLNLWNSNDRLDPDVGHVVTGNHTFEDDRFLRLRWEVRNNDLGQTWLTFEKGGEYQPFYAATPFVLNWKSNGGELRETNRAHNGTEAQVLQSSNYWFHSGLCYSHVSSVAFGPRILPAGAIFSSESISIFPKRDGFCLPLLALLVSTWVQDLIWVFGRYRKIENRAVSNLPIGQHIFSGSKDLLSRLARQGIECLMQIEQLDETSALFGVPDSIRERAINCGDIRGDIASSLESIYSEIDNQSSATIYGQEVPPLQSKPRNELVSIYARRTASNNEQFVAQVVSYSLGCILGRWDGRVGLDPELMPKLQDPFDPLPTCPPGMLIGTDGLPATPHTLVSVEWLRARPNAITLPPEGTVQHPTISETEYPIRIAWDGILVDDPGLEGQAAHPSDIVRRVREALTVLWSDNAEVIEAEACEMLGVQDLRVYLNSPARFFADHLKRYSKSRRQAPIYWPLSTVSGRYTVWVYYHRLTQDTLYTIVTKYVTPKIESVQKRVDHLADKLKDASGKTATELRDQFNDTKEFLSELDDFQAELLRVAQLPYKPDLNDGVIINAAPLNELFRLRKWANDTAAVWKKLEVGEYDWSHMGYTIWPERVKKKCETDRSIAIAHGLEELCKVDPTKVRKARKRKIDEEDEESD